ncbi:MAG: hypothetical protein K0R14_2182 [Burkholderiales bacterium]|jgi:osmotically-inducible protein OsmY|nr:hypothetical protein [Burkholderiales bacterium]
MKKTLCALILATGSTLIATGVANADTTTVKNKTETTGQYLKATSVTGKVKAALLTKSNIDSNNISVSSRKSSAGPGSIVILSGTQKSQELVDLAIATAKDVDGVDEVISKDLKVDPNK